MNIAKNRDHAAFFVGDSSYVFDSFAVRLMIAVGEVDARYVHSRAIIWRSVAGSLEAGPMVATILVCLLCKLSRTLVPLRCLAHALFYIGIQVGKRRLAA